MAAERIQFSLIHGNEDIFPRPFPASKEIPAWFKAMPSEAQGPDRSMRTLKNCPPFIEAMTCGYIIPVVADVSLSLDRAGVLQGQSKVPPYVNQRGAVVHAYIVQTHRPPQFPGAPFVDYPVVKILNPWLIRTPPGYSTLFLPLLNRYEMPLYPLAGLVETDLFYREVNFPAVLAISHGTTLNLPRGTPLVQVIPIKRDEFQSAFVPLDPERYETGRPASLADKENDCKNHFW